MFGGTVGPDIHVQVLVWAEEGALVLDLAGGWSWTPMSRSDCSGGWVGSPRGSGSGLKQPLELGVDG